jgi:hypothetical protein
LVALEVGLGLLRFGESLQRRGDGKVRRESTQEKIYGSKIEGFGRRRKAGIER